jgi:20S proteasome subunit beta 6
MVSVGMLLLLVCLVLGLYPLEGKFDPYVDNGGTVVGLAGRDYVMLASDTRLSDQYMIRSRRVSRVFEIEEGLLFSGSGCWADVVALSKELQAHAQKYEWEHEKKLSIRPLSYLMSSELYSKRFFPYFTFCMVAGLNKEGM